MASTQNVTDEPTFLDPRHTMWSLFLADVEKRDKGRLTQWKGNTDSILIFTGLFAATVATFVISTLPSLSPDSGVQTVALLSQVLDVLSNQTAGSPLGGTITATPPAFDTTDSALWVNSLWLVSLFLSLAVALTATLVQDWARTYTLNAGLHADIGKRGLVHAALDYGIEQFRMDILMSGILLLLHTSVFCFYVGMLVLIFSVNTTIATVLVALMAAGGLIYLVLSVLPIFFPDSPYRTPLTAPLIVVFNSTIFMCYISTLVCFMVLKIFWFMLMLCLGVIESIFDILSDITDFDWMFDAWMWLSDVTILWEPFSEWPSPSHPFFPWLSWLDPPLQVLSTSNQFSWYNLALRRLFRSADELPKMISVWESFISFVNSPKTEAERPGLAEKLWIVTAGNSYDADSLKASWRIRMMLKALDSEENGDAYFGRLTNVISAILRGMLEDKPASSKLARRALPTLYLGNDENRDNTPNSLLGSTGAFVLYMAELRAIILTMGLSDRSWFESYFYGNVFNKLNTMDADRAGFEVSDNITDNQVRIRLVNNFIGLVDKILDWVHVLGLTHVSETLQGNSSWLPIVQRVHEHALKNVQGSVSRAFYSRKDLLHPRSTSTLASLFIKLGIQDHSDLWKDDSADAPSSPSGLLVSVNPQYRAFFESHPDFAHMLYTLCAKLIDPPTATDAASVATSINTEGPAHEDDESSQLHGIEQNGDRIPFDPFAEATISVFAELNALSALRRIHEIQQGSTAPLSLDVAGAERDGADIALTGDVVVREASAGPGTRGSTAADIVEKGQVIVHDYAATNETSFIELSVIDAGNSERRVNRQAKTVLPADGTALALDYDTSSIGVSPEQSPGTAQRRADAVVIDMGGDAGDNAQEE